MNIAQPEKTIHCSGNNSQTTPSAADRYKIIGPLYDFLSTIYSGRQIYETKIAMNTALKEDDKVLFAGAGHGRDAIDAAKRGAQVTVVDLSATMLKKIEKNMTGKKFKHPVNLVHSDILKFNKPGEYDQVVANFFLNVFPEDTMHSVMKHLGSLTKPGGCFVVGDFHYPNGNILTRTFQNIYWYIAVFLFTVFAKNAFHKIYNYPKHLESLGFSIIETRAFNIFHTPLLWSLKARRTPEKFPN